VDRGFPLGWLRDRGLGDRTGHRLDSHGRGLRARRLENRWLTGRCLLRLSLGDRGGRELGGHDRRLGNVQCLRNLWRLIRQRLLGLLLLESGSLRVL
jgi:hypothetical protein